MSRTDPPLDLARRQAMFSGAWRDPARPWVVSVIGYVSIAFGYIFFLLKGAYLLVQFVDESWIRENVNVDFARPDITPLEFLIGVLILLVGIGLSLASLAGGIGLLKLRQWGRRLVMLYAIGAITMTILVGIWKLARVDREIELAMQSTTRPVEGFNIDEQRNFVFANSVIQPIVMLVWPITILTILTRAHVRKAF
jgi:hypothetical protein